MKTPGQPGYDEYVSNLKEFIKVNNDRKSKEMKKTEALKSDYPKTYMMSKINRLLDQREGLSEFETYSGFSEAVYSRPVGQKERHYVPKSYNLDDL